jgi:hypothetical protein
MTIKDLLKARRCTTRSRANEAGTVGNTETGATNFFMVGEEHSYGLLLSNGKGGKEIVGGHGDGRNTRKLEEAGFGALMVSEH